MLIARPTATVVYGAVDRGGLMSDKFNDVDFTAGCPAAVFFVFWEHPNSRPESATLGQLSAYFEAPICPCGATLGAYAPAGIFLLHACNVDRFFVGFDDECSIFNPYVLRQI